MEIVVKLLAFGEAARQRIFHASPLPLLKIFNPHFKNEELEKLKHKSKC